MREPGKAPAAAPSQAPPWRKSVARDYFEAICVAVIFALFVRTFIAQAFKIPSKSMENSLLVGDHIVVDKFSFAPHPAWMESFLPYRPIRDCDVIVFKFPENPERDFIKRVIGTPGQRVEVRGATVLRDGQAVDEPYAVYKNPFTDAELRGETRNLSKSMEPTTLGPGRYLALGDNRLNSQDSRYWGTVSSDLIKGHALLIYWSFNVPPALQPVELEEGDVRSGRARLLLYTARHFFGETRWSRSFRRIRCGPPG